MLTGAFLDGENPDDTVKSAYTGKLSPLSWSKGMLFYLQSAKKNPKNPFCLKINMDCANSKANLIEIKSTVTNT